MDPTDDAIHSTRGQQSRALHITVQISTCHCKSRIFPERMKMWNVGITRSIHGLGSVIKYKE